MAQIATPSQRKSPPPPSWGTDLTRSKSLLFSFILLRSFDPVRRVWSFCKTINCIVLMNIQRCRFELTWDAHFSPADIDFSWPRSPPLVRPNRHPLLRGLVWPGLNRHFSLTDFILLPSFDPVRRVWSFCKTINCIILKRNIWRSHYELVDLRCAFFSCGCRV